MNKIELAVKKYFPNAGKVEFEDTFALIFFKFGYYSILSLVIEEETDNKYVSYFLRCDDIKEFIYESTNLTELMQVTKQKLTDMLAD